MSDGLRIAALAPRHRARLAEIVRATGVFSADEVSVAVELFDESFGPPGSDYSFVGAFTTGEELVGYACYGPTPATDRTFDLYWIAVDPAVQRTGTGSILMTEVERRLQDERARMLVVETSSRSDYAPTRAFYQRRGYMEAGRVRGFYAPGDDRIILTKRFQYSPSGGERSGHE
ncbi:MAG TPA: GNAT family N-acetyltransferase [Gemmatimonadaceae bacterium]|nr:GNAT family N-acetyltransferase [Gemmatimonadaceae bacterium]